jgi:hypothetical protein
MKRWTFLGVMFLATFAFLFITFSPYGWLRAYSILLAKFSGRICRSSFCFSTATKTLHYTHNKVLHYCGTHAKYAPRVYTIYHGLLGYFALGFYLLQLIALLSSCFIFASAIKGEYHTWEDMEPLEQPNWKTCKLYLLLLIVANFGAWVGALLALGS